MTELPELIFLGRNRGSAVVPEREGGVNNGA